MEIRDLQYFLAIVRSETICGAAESLHLTQPTVSRQMMQLEEELGTKLFHRGKRRISLTEDGHFLYRRAVEIVELVDKTKNDLCDSHKSVSGTVVIGGGETQAMRHVARACVQARRDHPLLSFRLYSGNGDDVHEKLDRGLLDFAIFIEPFEMGDYEFIRLPLRNVWGLLLRKDHPLAAREHIVPADLAGVPLLASRQTMVENEFAGWMGGGQAGTRLDIVATYNLLYNASLMVEEGLGCALCLEGIVRTPAEGTLCFRPLHPRMEVGVNLAWRKSMVLSRAAALFLQYVKRMLGTDQAPDSGDGSGETCGETCGETGGKTGGKTGRKSGETFC